MRSLLPLSFIFLAGCTTHSVTDPGELRASQAVKARYWAIQARQRSVPERFVPLVLPERVEDGALRVPTLVEIPFP